MKLCIVAALLAVGCGSKKEAEPTPGPGSARPRPTVTDPVGFCARATVVMEGRRKCFPEDTSIKMGLDELAGLERDAPADPDKRRHVAAQCAVMLDGMMRAEQPKNCPLDVTDTERTELSTFLTAWYGERTPAPTSGNATADAAVAKIAAARDSACACKDLACAHKAGDGLPKQVEELSSETPKASLDAATKMLDEVTRCRQKLAYGPPP